MKAFAFMLLMTTTIFPVHIRRIINFSETDKVVVAQALDDKYMACVDHIKPCSSIMMRYHVPFQEHIPLINTSGVYLYQLSTKHAHLCILVNNKELYFIAEAVAPHKGVMTRGVWLMHDFGLSLLAPFGNYEGWKGEIWWMDDKIVWFDWHHD